MSVALLLMATKAHPQTAPPISADALGMHNMSVQSGSSVSTQGTLGCTFCHAPHSGIGGNTPLWNQRLSVQSYTTYTSTTYHQQGSAQPTLGASSILCLSCHDGTVAVGQTQAYGKIPVTGNLNNMDSFGTTLTGSHPFSLVLPIKDAPNLALSVSEGSTADPTGAVKLVNGNIECNTCHDPHSQYIDPVAQNFLVKDSSNGKLCAACHDPTRVVTGQVNQLSGWQASVHATATNQVASTGNVGLYPTVSVNACSSCHMEHNAPSPARLLRPATPAATSVDPSTQDCITCHSSTSGSSSSNNSYINPVPPPVYNEVAKMYSHPIPSGNNGHDAAEAVVLNNNRHATCVDCHNPHATQATILPFPNPPAVRLPQTSVTGLSALDGLTLLNPVVNQYESCLRCHSPSLGKQASIKYGYLPTRFVFATDALNVFTQFSPSATSSHPVMHIRSSAFPQPSLLTNMLNIDGDFFQGVSWGNRYSARIATTAMTIANSAGQDQTDLTDRILLTFSAELSVQRSDDTRCAGHKTFTRIPIRVTSKGRTRCVPSAITSGSCFRRPAPHFFLQRRHSTSLT